MFSLVVQLYSKVIESINQSIRFIVLNHVTHRQET